MTVTDNDRYLLLVTRRRSGERVPTPVWFAADGDELLIWTGAGAGKVRRVRANPEVTVAPCTLRGRPTGPESPAIARILPAAEGPRARARLAAKYGLQWRGLQWYNRVTALLRRTGGPPAGPAYLSITLNR